jgi:hypothetical protein
VTALAALLQEFYLDKLAMMLDHEAGARLVRQYDVNNTYQYILAREEVQLSWVAAAIADLGETVPAEPSGPGAPSNRESVAAVLGSDAQEAAAFVERWRPRVDGISNARHRGMLRVILGETLEHRRFFEQALAGRTDLLGRHPDHLAGPTGEVLSTRWIG